MASVDWSRSEAESDIRFAKSTEQKYIRFKWIDLKRAACMFLDVSIDSNSFNLAPTGIDILASSDTSCHGGQGFTACKKTQATRNNVVKCSEDGLQEQANIMRVKHIVS